MAKSGTKPYRLGAFVDGVGWVEHKFGRVWQRENGRLVAAPDRDHVDLILQLAGCMAEPLRVRYDLLVPKDGDGQDEGIFELVQPLSHPELSALLSRYRELFENDGRHHLRVESGDASILYDQHNVLILHGPVEAFVAVLGEAGLAEGDVRHPSPHSHHYHEELDHLLEDMLQRYEWHWYPH